MPVIHVCSLARLHATVEATGAQHVVTLLKHTDRVERPRSVAPANHLILGMDDITVPTDGYTIPCDEHVTALITFVRGWERARPLVLHCYAGISRSTAGAYVAACALNPRRDEWAIARALRRATAAWWRRSTRSDAARSPTRPTRSGSTWNSAWLGALAQGPPATVGASTSLFGVSGQGYSPVQSTPVCL